MPHHKKLCKIIDNIGEELDLMPKIARVNRHQYSESTEILRFRQEREYRNYSNSDFHFSANNKYKNDERYSSLRKSNRPLKRKRKKTNPLHFLIFSSLVMLLFCTALPFSFNNITKAMFVPTPYKSIQTDMYDLSFPTTKYLSNSWFEGKRMFSFSANEKKSQMIPIKENVNMPVLKQELLTLMENYKTIKPAIFVWDYETQNYVDINASESYATASIIKIPVLIDVFKSIEAGQFSLDDKIPLTEYYKTEGSGSLQFKARDSEYTIDKLAEVMITESDNSATNMLISQVGSMTDVNQSIRDWGLKETKVQTWLPDLKGTNRTTAREMATMLYNIDENDKFLSASSRNKIFNYMGHVHNNRLIQAGLGADAVFLHKTGDIGSMLGDAGIVIAPNGKKYIVVILANRPHNSFAGKEFIVKASEIIYKYMVR